MSTPFSHDRPDFVFLAVRHTVAALHPEAEPDAIFSPTTRGDMAAARARQLAMYVMADRLGVPQGETGRQFGRDRSTVTHAVQTVRDLVDRCPLTSWLVDCAERQARALLDLFAHVEAESRPVISDRPRALRHG